ncbi:MAG: hypothetical protein KAW12_07135 [Candidatus Aminicenantes bacterium]|nr:hypothetical protein [Candidatus Aminicenantes bacterium]
MNKLMISSENPRYFKYRGKVQPLIGAGYNGTKNSEELRELGVNLVTFGVMPWGEKSPYVGGPGASVDNNWNDFSSGYWKGFEGEIRRCQKLNMVCLIYIFSTCLRKKGKGTWSHHLWNKKNGGPIDANNGVGPFYAMGSDNVLYGKKTYESLTSWQAKSQYRQEELIAKTMHILEKYPNTGVILSWELYDQFNLRWTAHMVEYMRSLSSIPIGLGTWLNHDVGYVRRKTGVNVFMFMEGAVPSYPIHHGKKRTDLLTLGKSPLVVNGFQAQLPDSRYSALQKTRKCKFFCPGMERENIINICTHMLGSIRIGANISLPFPFWWKDIRTDYVARDCAAQYPEIKNYDIKFVNNEVKKFMKTLHRKMQKIDWKREPGRVVSNDWGKELLPVLEEPVRLTDPILPGPGGEQQETPGPGDEPVDETAPVANSSDLEPGFIGFIWSFFRDAPLWVKITLGILAVVILLLILLK